MISAVISEFCIMNSTPISFSFFIYKLAKVCYFVGEYPIQYGYINLQNPHQTIPKTLLLTVEIYGKKT